MGQKLAGCVGYIGLENAISMWGGLCEQGCGGETRQEGEIEREKWKIPAGT